MKKTREVVQELGTSYWSLVSALRGGKIDPLPAKDASGDLTWSAEDVARARAALSIDRRLKKSVSVPTMAT